jgi:hypothetical protein
MSEKILISSFRNIKDKSPQDMGLDDFISGVRTGIWQDAVLRIRTIADKKSRQTEKEKCPNVRISGSFTSYSDKDLRKHSGYIAIDLDDTTQSPEVVKEMVANDPYVSAAFTSISGNGVCLLFKIDPTRHLDSFEGLAAYLYESYGLIVDQSGKNVSRARYVSFDPHLIENPSASLFKKYLPKKKAAPVNKVVFVQSDFDEIITQLYSKGVNLTETYHEWVSIAYSLISQYAEGGLEYFHTLSSLSSKYDHGATGRQYSNCLKSHATGGRASIATIATIYHHAKQAGVDIYSTRTKEIIRATVSQSKAGVKAPEIANYLEKFQEISAAEALPIVTSIISNNVTQAEGNIIDDIQGYLGQYALQRNTITRNLETNNRLVDDTEINSIYCDLKSIDKEISKDLVLSVMYSNRTQSYNPILKWYSENKETARGGQLDALCRSIITDTQHHEIFITKWLVSIIASIHGYHSPLALVLTGGIRKGKTQFFRRLLPRALKQLYSEQKIRDDKDAFILMTKKLICMNDEWDGMSKAEDTFFKSLMDKDLFSIREPYGRISVDLKRLAVVCGTSNTKEIILDPDNNRRIIPVDVNSIDFALYNSVDKGALFLELWDMYLAGYDYEMSFDDIQKLLESSECHNIISSEAELLHANFTKPASTMFAKQLTNSEILAFLKKETGAVLSPKRLGAVLKNSGFEQARVKKNGQVQRIYYVEYTRPVAEGLPH